jgi:hypothetical protein
MVAQGPQDQDPADTEERRRVVSQAKSDVITGNRTIYGTISSALIGHGYFEQHRSTNKKCFLSYIENLKARIKPECLQQRLIMVLDNHSAHKGWEVCDLLDTFC